MDRIERSRNPLSRLQVVQPIKHEPPVFTARDYDDLVHWSIAGKTLTALIIVGSGVYVLAAVLGWVS